MGKNSQGHRFSPTLGRDGGQGWLNIWSQENSSASDHVFPYLQPSFALTNQDKAEAHQTEKEQAQNQQDKTLPCRVVQWLSIDL